MQVIIEKYNYIFYFILFCLGLYAMMAKNNLFKKIIGMSIFQASIILFYISIGLKAGGNVPILEVGKEVNISEYVNPLPHVLMLTAIVVGVSTLAVSLSLLQKIHKNYKTIEEDEVLEQMEE